MLAPPACIQLARREGTVPAEPLCQNLGPILSLFCGLPNRILCGTCIQLQSMDTCLGKMDYQIPAKDNFEDTCKICSRQDVHCRLAFFLLAATKGGQKPIALRMLACMPCPDHASLTLDSWSSPGIEGSQLTRGGESTSCEPTSRQAVEVCPPWTILAFW